MTFTRYALLFLRRWCRSPRARPQSGARRPSHQSVPAGRRAEAMPVPRHALLISDNPASGPPRRILTALDGTVEVRLPPGSYIVESDRPFAFQGKGYQWTQVVDVVAGRDVDARADRRQRGGRRAPARAETTTPGAATVAGTLVYFSINGKAASSSSGRRPHTRRDSSIDPNGLDRDEPARGRRRDVDRSAARAERQSRRTVLAADPMRDVAVLWIDKAARRLGAARAARMRAAAASPRERPGDRRHRSAPRQQKDTASGTVESVVAHAIISDLTLDEGTDGGPVFTLDGGFVGIASVVDERTAPGLPRRPPGRTCARSSRPRRKP